MELLQKYKKFLNNFLEDDEDKELTLARLLISPMLIIAEIVFRILIYKVA